MPEFESSGNPRFPETQWKEMCIVGFCERFVHELEFDMALAAESVSVKSRERRIAFQRGKA